VSNQYRASKVDVPPKHWDRIFAPSSCLAYQTIDVGIPYEGPEVALFEKELTFMFKGDEPHPVSRRAG
jgi:hypothetical protein